MSVAVLGTAKVASTILFISIGSLMVSLAALLNEMQEARGSA